MAKNLIEDIPQILKDIKIINQRLDDQHDHDMKIMKIFAEVNGKLDMYDARLKRLEDHIYGKDGAGLIRVMSNIETIKDNLEKKEYDDKDAPTDPKLVEKAIEEQIEKRKADELLRDIGNYYGLKNGSSTMDETEKKKDILKPVVSYTTRPMRPTETNGKEHIFITEEDLKFTFDEREFAAYTEINGYKYFTTFQQLRECNAYIIDPIGINSLLFNKNAKSRKLELFVIYILTSTENRYNRYIKREDIHKTKEELSLEFIQRDSAEERQFTLFESCIQEAATNVEYPKYTQYDNLSEWPWTNIYMVKDQVTLSNPTTLELIHNGDMMDERTFNCIIFDNNGDRVNEQGIQGLGKIIKDTYEGLQNCGDLLFCFVGRTASGKDTICRKIMDYVNN